MEWPKQGAIIIADAEPHAGLEYGGHSPVSGNIRRHYLVVSANAYNQATGMFVGMPITTADHHDQPQYQPILINGNAGTGVKGYVVLWQLQNFDFSGRNGRVVNQVTPQALRHYLGFVKDIFWE